MELSPLRRKTLVLTSFVLVAFGQPALSGLLAVLASAFGFAIFWQNSRRTFWSGTLWFTAVQAVQLSWLGSTEYMGPLIFVVYAFLAFGIGLQFGFLTTLIRPPFTWLRILGISGLWVLMEWVRVYLFTGFTWNPVGLSLAANDYSIQFASLFGIYGLCFWVIFTNLLALKSKKIWLVAALLPYVFGFCHQSFWGQSAEKNMSVALIQTAMRPEQRDLMAGHKEAHVNPFVQWHRILSYLDPKGSFDLIVLPEGALPGGAKRPIYPLAATVKLWEQFGTPDDFPPLVAPYAYEVQGKWQVTNSFWLQSLANHYGTEVIAGVDDDHYNAAFHYMPFQQAVSRYEKQILIPVGEYVPFQFLARALSDAFGIEGSFNAGKTAKVFEGKKSMGIFICLEETYSHLVRETKRKGAEIFVNITNDVWFPETRLPWHHFDHGRVRAAENGTYLLRSCNTGVTAAVDCYGATLGTFPVSEKMGGVLTLNIPVKSVPTLYTFWGDLPILLVSALFTFTLMRKKKLP